VREELKLRLEGSPAIAAAAVGANLGGAKSKTRRAGGGRNARKHSE